jgi:hypothetical protein
LHKSEIIRAEDRSRGTATLTNQTNFTCQSVVRKKSKRRQTPSASARHRRQFPRRSRIESGLRPKWPGFARLFHLTGFSLLQKDAWQRQAHFKPRKK